MFCKNCGQKLPDGAKFCSKCGTVTKVPVVNVDNVQQEQNQVDKENVNTTPVQVAKKSMDPKMIITIALCAVIVVIALVFKFVGGSAQDQEAEIASMEEEGFVDQEYVSEEVETENAYEAEEALRQAEEEAREAEALRQAEEEAREAEEAEREALEAEYILPDSASRYLTASDIAGLSQGELRIARNEIYARLGRRFKSDDLRAYFLSKSWYQERVDEIYESDMNAFEIANVALIQSYE